MKVWFGSILALAAASLACAQDTDPAAQEDNILRQDAHEIAAYRPLGFDEVDTDDDGQLSIDEARIALPSLQIADKNGDALVNQQEVEVLLPELHFASRGREGGEAVVGKIEFDLIVHTLDTGDVENRNQHDGH